MWIPQWTSSQITAKEGDGCEGLGSSPRRADQVCKVVKYALPCPSSGNSLKQVPSPPIRRSSPAYSGPIAANWSAACLRRCQLCVIQRMLYPCLSRYTASVMPIRVLPLPVGSAAMWIRVRCSWRAAIDRTASRWYGRTGKRSRIVSTGEGEVSGSASPLLGGYGGTLASQVVDGIDSPDCAFGCSN